MDANEVLALSIVAIAALLALRCFFVKKGGGCCNSGCFPGNGPKSESKEKKVKPEDRK